MKKNLFFLLILFSCSLCAQVKDVRGLLIIPGGKPAKLSFTVKNRNISGSTDRNGYFILRNITDEDIVVCNYREYPISSLIVEVLSEKPLPPASSLLEAEKDTLGVAFLQSYSPKILPDYSRHYNNSYRINQLSNIREIKKKDDYNYQIVHPRTYTKYSGFSLNYSAYVDFSTIGKMPELQKQYAQGQGGEWRGSDQNEIFSWGPEIKNLEYSGINYPYDKKGTLVASGSGNGTPAETYYYDDFFRTGISFGNSVNMSFPCLLKGYTSLSLGQKKWNSPIPNADSELYNVAFSLNKMKMGRFTTDLGMMYKTSQSNLAQQGSNSSTLLHSVLTTPPTFDNNNGLSRKNAAKDNAAWQLADGSNRSYATNLVENPYMIINTLPDNKTNENLLFYGKTKYKHRNWSGDLSLNYDKIWDKYESGLLSSSKYRTSRKEENANTALNSMLSYKIKDYKPDLEVYAAYGLKHTTLDVNRKDEYYLSGNLIDTISNASLSRTAHDVKYGMTLSTDNFDLRFANKHYFSNTLYTANYTNLFPEVSFRLRMRDFLDNLMYDLFRGYFYDNLDLYGTISRSIGESSLIYRNLASLSTNIKAENFADYNEYREIFAHKNLKPETYLKSEIGLNWTNGHWGRHELSGELNFFNYNTTDLILPVWEQSTLQPLDNVGKLRNYGYFIGLTYNLGMGRHKYLNIAFTFSQAKNKITKLYGEESYISIAGFSDLALVAQQGEALGTIYGTDYQRNESGELIVGSDGFPLVDTNLKKLGNPNPDFQMTLNPTFNYNKFNLSVTMEYLHGGDRWNGTRAMLDYYGVSAGTANDRTIKNYVFNGVYSDGSRNTTEVDFYDPTKSINENRWVRYGKTGVGSEYIEKASCFRISEISLSYYFLKDSNKFIQNLSLGFNIHNVLLLTKYTGVDPSSTLFGYASGLGLDLFNQPSTRNYSVSLTLDF